MQNVFDHVGKILDGGESSGDRSSALLAKAGSGEAYEDDLAFEIFLGDFVGDHVDKAEMREGFYVAVEVHQHLVVRVGGNQAVAHLDAVAFRKNLAGIEVEIDARDLQGEGWVFLAVVFHDQGLAADGAVALGNPVDVADGFGFLGEAVDGRDDALGIEVGAFEL